MSSVTDKFFFPPIISHATIRGTIYKISCEQEKEYHMYRAAQTRYDSMQYPHCGDSGLRLPAVSLGFWHNFGSTV